MTDEIVEHLKWLKCHFPDHTIYEIIIRAVQTVNPSLTLEIYGEDVSWDEIITDQFLLTSLQKFRQMTEASLNSYLEPQGL